MQTFEIRDEFIKLGQALKAAGFVESGVDAKFADICSPMVFETITTGRLAAHWEHHTGHSLAFRRYYRQFDY